jgi:hypothetical protein
MNHDHPGTVIQAPPGAHPTRTIGPGVVCRLRETARANGATLDETLLTAFAVLLYRRTGQSEVVVATSDLALRIDLSGNPPFLAGWGASAARWPSDPGRRTGRRHAGGVF